ncbi:MAG TPA: hypothetical protein VLN41_01485 [Candidatus Bathyarchaeia archaeon]|nr:hypothetical protein [Candidatus Bathyarchaeia archaeon]
MDDKIPLTEDDIARLRRREAEIVARIDRLKRTMSETKAIDTLAFKSKLYNEALDELRRVQDKLAGVSDD